MPGRLPPGTFPLRAHLLADATGKFDHFNKDRLRVHAPGCNWLQATRYVPFCPLRWNRAGDIPRRDVSPSAQKLFCIPVMRPVSGVRTGL